MSTSPNEFFNDGGGTLSVEDPSYVSREADDKLYDGLSRGEYCFVLTSRQMGKSSLAIRIAERLRAEETAVAQLDLTTVGHALKPEQWYYGLLFSLGEQLDLQSELEEFWQSHEDLGPLQRWMQAVHDVILERCPGPVVLIIDEIDYVRRLPFSTDELFAAIRACFNRRADDPPMRLLSFCLLGTVTPSELIKDPNTTPFNIGRRIELNDFTEAEAATLARGLGRGEATNAQLMRRVYHWTGGQPYLTQSLCHAVAKATRVVDTKGVDGICRTLFLSGRARATDKNLQFVGGHLLNQEDQRRANLLDLYAKVHRGRAIPDDETSPLCGTLRLSGLVRVVDRHLRVRNQIYQQVFDQRWIRNALPDSEVVRRRRAFRQGAMTAGSLALLLIGLIGASVYYIVDHYYLEHVSYTKQWRKRFGVPEEISQLTEEQLRHRPGSFKFYRHGHNGPVTKIQWVNSSGNPSVNPHSRLYLDSGLEDEDEVVKPLSPWTLWEFVRDDEGRGRLVYELLRDQEGQFRLGYIYSPARSNERLPPPFGTGSLVPKRPSDTIAHFVDRTGFPHHPKNCAAEFVEVWRTRKGDEEAVCFFDRNNKPKPNRAGIYGYKSEFDLLGRPIKMTFLGPDGRPMLCRYGYSAIRFSYNADGDQDRLDYLGLDELPILNFKGFASQTIRYDNFGNTIECAYWDTHNRRVSTKNGYSKCTLGYDDRGNIIICRFFNERDDPTPAKDGTAYWTAAYDASGNAFKVQFWDAKDKRILRLTRAFDEQGNIIDEQLWGPDLKPVRYKDGYHRRKSVYDRFSNQLEERYRDEDNRPCRCKQGFAGWIRRLDEHGREVMIMYLDESGRPTQHDEGYIKKRTEYDDHSNPIKVTYWDESDRSTATSKGIHEIESVYDELNNKVEERYLGVQGDPVIVGGNAGWKARYDAGRHVFEKTYYDRDGKPGVHPDGYFRLTASYDLRGNRTEEAYFDEHGRPARHKDGYARWTARYDERGNQVELAYFDEAGQPTRHKGGYTRLTKEYDERGRLARQMEWGYDGSNGFTRALARYDERGNMVEANFLDEAGRPARHKDGYARLTKQYDEEGALLNITYYGIDGDPVTTHLMVAEIVPDGQAKAIGLEPGDIILSYDGKDGLNQTTFNRAVQAPGEGTRELHILRHGAVLTFQVQPGKLGIGIVDRAVQGEEKPSP